MGVWRRIEPDKGYAERTLRMKKCTNLFVAFAWESTTNIYVFNHLMANLTLKE